MSEEPSGLKRVVSATGVYALSAVAQRGLAFFLLPIYTRFIDPAEYGALELLNAFASVLFAFLMFGLPSAILKCYHRDCETDEERGHLLPTAIGLVVPVLAVAGGVLYLVAGPLARLLIGEGTDPLLVRLVVATSVLSGLGSLFAANLRAQERAIAYSVHSISGFLIAMTANVTLVVYYQMGIRGVLWGNLAAALLSLPIGAYFAGRGVKWGFLGKLVRPMLRFGIPLIPVMLAGWVMELSDRYVLRLFGALDEVAVYGVGYKLGMVLQLTVVWPFQLAWPAVAFEMSKREGHREVYARTLTYLLLVLIGTGVALSVTTRVVLIALVGEGYRNAYQVVPLVALGYVFNGLQYSVSPGVHVAEKTRLLPPVALVAALFNLAFNFLLIPRWGMMGAAWATAGAYFVLALGTSWVAQRFYPVRYEYGRLVKLVAAGAVVLFAGTRVAPAVSALSITWHLAVGLLAFPLALLALRFVSAEERRAVARAARRYLPFADAASESRRR